MIRRLRCALFVGALAITAHVAAQTPSPPKPSKDADITCPYLRQQKIDRHASQIADPDMGRDVLDNLKRLKQADNLLEMAKELARDGLLEEAMECCNRAAVLCPGSPCAERAVETMLKLALGIVPPANGSEETAEPQPANDRNFTEQYYKRPWDLDPNFDTFLFIKQQQSNQVLPASIPGIEQLVSSLMEACHLLMNQGMQHEAAELARQAYALDPQRVGADPLIYKMHLLSESRIPQPTGASEASEPPTCPYCPNSGKPLREIVPEKTPPVDNYEWEVGVNSGGLRLCADCALNGNVYHMRYKHGRLAIWKTTDAGQTKP